MPKRKRTSSTTTGRVRLDRPRFKRCVVYGRDLPLDIAKRRQTILDFSRFSNCTMFTSSLLNIAQCDNSVALLFPKNNTSVLLSYSVFSKIHFPEKQLVDYAPTINGVRCFEVSPECTMLEIVCFAIVVSSVRFKTLKPSFGVSGMTSAFVVHLARHLLNEFSVPAEIIGLTHIVNA